MFFSRLSILANAQKTCFYCTCVFFLWGDRLQKTLFILLFYSESLEGWTSSTCGLRLVTQVFGSACSVAYNRATWNEFRYLKEDEPFSLGCGDNAGYDVEMTIRRVIMILIRTTF